MTDLPSRDPQDREPESAQPAGAAARSPPAEAGRGGFLGFVAHEIRNPLATALWSAELLARLAPQERGGARGEKLVGMALRALQKLRLLVEDHFLAERLDASGLPVRREPAPLREALDGAVQRAAPALQVDVEVDPALAVLADRTLLERALEGLVAVATRGAVPARVVAAADAGRRSVTVRFTGARPPPDALATPQKGTASDPAGRALAVYMCVRVASALGGALTVADGSYVLVLPLAEAPPAPAGAGA